MVTALKFGVFFQHWDWNPGSHTHWVNALPLSYSPKTDPALEKLRTARLFNRTPCQVRTY